MIEERLDQLLEELQIQHLRTNQAISLSGTPDELVNDQAVRKIYLGENFRM